MTDTFSWMDPGLAESEILEIAAIRAEIADLVRRVRVFEPHRSLSLAVTRLEEADLWLGDRLRKRA